jgi:hypothetical protein
MTFELGFATEDGLHRGGTCNLDASQNGPIVRVERKEFDLFNVNFGRKVLSAAIATFHQPVQDDILGAFSAAARRVCMEVIDGEIDSHKDGTVHVTNLDHLCRVRVWSVLARPPCIGRRYSAKHWCCKERL